ncbi:hypothetical protein [Spirosoma luteum]|uniref:hypothetical protein n=1 Tax=Spirosoma luteum TaxID=431553 RepID=UPI0012F87C18|nr:hypothetical protein [Spirosoma luteum]
MRKALNLICVLAMTAGVLSCKKDPDPQAQLPSYLRVPATLTGYAGSGLITVAGGGLNLRAEGPEQLNTTTNTYSGVLGQISTGDINAYFTVGQPRIYKESSQVPNDYQANGALAIINTVSPGTYPMNAQAPSPRGEFADLVLKLPGPQIYNTQGGSLIISESTLIKTQGTANLYRVQGTFQATLNGSGIGTIPGKPIDVSGTFDLLFVQN